MEYRITATLSFVVEAETEDDAYDEADEYLMGDDWDYTHLIIDQVTEER